LSKKRQYFRQKIRRNYFKSHNIGPWAPCSGHNRSNGFAPGNEAAFKSLSRDQPSLSPSPSEQESENFKPGSDVRPDRNRLTVQPRLPDFSCYNIPKRENTPKGPQNIPNGHKMFQMAVNQPEWP
jgi:hypothetical protein